jgi:hypothetical protein
MIRRMAAPRALTLVIALALVVWALAACATPPAGTPSPIPASTVEPTPSAMPVSSAPQATPAASTSPSVDPAAALRIAAPYALVEPSASDYEQLSGNIRGLAADLAGAAGPEFDLTDFPLGFRFIEDGPRSVGVLVVIAMPPELASVSGLLESVAPPVAAEVNALLSYETVDGVKVAVLKGPIASALAIVDGSLVMAQSGQPAVRPVDLMAAVIEASGAGPAD